MEQQKLTSTPTTSFRTPKTNRKVIRSRERTVVSNIIEACVQEASSGTLLAPITCPNKRAALYTRKGIATIGRVRKERKDSPRGDLKSPQKPRTRVPVVIDNFDRSVIRQTIEHFYLHNYKLCLPSGNCWLH